MLWSFSICNFRFSFFSKCIYLHKITIQIHFYWMVYRTTDNDKFYYSFILHIIEILFSVVKVPPSGVTQNYMLQLAGNCWSCFFLEYTHSEVSNQHIANAYVIGVKSFCKVCGLQHWGNPLPVSPYVTVHRMDVTLVNKTTRHQAPCF